ncbi:beta-lactamase-like protein [Stachybotrys elegans]|uniref:Protein artemis n=1 Tax=Stachybotrys elegans TaxID=80388 RepID=A0A8K0SUZ2_9HYPO|nr:beta-lactamase-like protein [Stachybotrys elegans]
MSTFDGRVAEFPDITIDYFRHRPGSLPPLACFLSHVHSDHLAGLETLRSPFVYCSPGTKNILLRLERYPCRISYSKGILEARQQTYKHLHKILKPLPLDTPTVLELKPGHSIQVTLLDANHCPGSVMFLIESQEHAVLYTGDIRSEPWFVNRLARNPNLIEYTSGIRTLDTIYLDTSFIDDVPFQTKAQGLAELLRKVKQYPPDTVFHLQAWTYGYEDVWIALSKALNSPIHVDDYKLRVYGSLRARPTDDRLITESHLTPEAPALTGFMCGNTPRPGCLTSDENVRLHSCEKGNICATARHPSVVTIQPIIAHLPDGADIVEVGVGGGGDDLEREVELDSLSHEDITSLLDILRTSKDLPKGKHIEIQAALAQAAVSGRSVALSLDISSLGDDLSANLHDALQALLAKKEQPTTTKPCQTSKPSLLPRIIRFPYSRHSSYQELCELVALFRPRDVWPCTVDPDAWLRAGITIRALFGESCSSQAFAHDAKLAGLARIRQEAAPPPPATESQDSSCSSTAVAPGHAMRGDEGGAPNSQVPESTNGGCNLPVQQSRIALSKRSFDEYSNDARHTERDEGEEKEDEDSVYSAAMVRQIAYQQMLRNIMSDNEHDWTPISLISAGANHTLPEKEL